MELKKANDTYDVYTAKLSYLELGVLADALRAGGEGPVADELRRSFEWHIDRLPGPGQDEKDKDAEKEGAEGKDLGADAAPAVEPELDPEVKAEADKLLPPPPAEGEDLAAV